MNFAKPSVQNLQIINLLLHSANSNRWIVKTRKCFCLQKNELTNNFCSLTYQPHPSFEYNLGITSGHFRRDFFFFPGSEFVHAHVTHEHISLTCKASRRSNMLIGGRGAGSMSAEQANKWTACCSASSGDTWGGGPAGRDALGGGLKKERKNK